MVEAPNAVSAPRRLSQSYCGLHAIPLQGREGNFILKYFLVDRPRIQAKAARDG
jgi:hypothetical protein